jgi:hypothetical protein
VPAWARGEAAVVAAVSRVRRAGGRARAACRRGRGERRRRLAGVGAGRGGGRGGGEVEGEEKGEGKEKEE